MFLYLCKGQICKGINIYVDLVLETTMYIYSIGNMLIHRTDVFDLQLIGVQTSLAQMMLVKMLQAM